ncbi:hypothetical protein E2562_026158 [Oryza meyeriana var. granulata]|uniref:Uncharacterized protein n=1 Tax=Oryza meyeriana var. granulata TaxID=110450 RepID=A0A6G1E245_9ORYZ|nr:hypothetical protein E2562_026158 [Oryza meyeriana var. granulata]
MGTTDLVTLAAQPVDPDGRARKQAATPTLFSSGGKRRVEAGASGSLGRFCPRKHTRDSVDGGGAAPGAGSEQIRRQRWRVRGLRGSVTGLAGVEVSSRKIDGGHLSVMFDLKRVRIWGSLFHPVDIGGIQSVSG